MKNKEKIFTYLIALILILCIGTKLMSCKPSSSKNKIKEKIEEIKEENNKEHTWFEEIEKIEYIVIFITSNQKELSLTNEQIEEANKAYEEYIKKSAKELPKHVGSLFLKGVSLEKVNKKNIDNYYATLKDILPKEIYNKCVSFSAEELKNLVFGKMNKEYKEMFAEMKEDYEKNKEYYEKLEKDYEKNKELVEKHNIDLE